MDLFELGLKADTRDLRRGKKDLENFARAGDKTERSINKSMAGSERSIRGVRQEAMRLNQILAAAGLVTFSRQAIQYADAWRGVNNQLRQVVDTEAQLVATRQQVFAIAKSTNAELGVTVNLYSELYRSTRDLNVSQERVAGVAKTINNLFKAGGKAASETAGAVRQLAQGLAAGALRGDEFNSVAEGAPRIMDALAVKLRMGRGELREFAATGGITAKILIDALEDYSDEAQRMADLTEETFGQKLTNARSNVTKFAGESNSLTDAVDLLGDGIEGLSENLDGVMDAALIAAGVMSGRFVVAMGAASAGMVTATASAVSLRGALSFLGGVPGVIISALAGVGAMVYNAEKAKTALEELSETALETAINLDFGELGSKSVTQLAEKSAKAESAISSLNQVAESLREKIGNGIPNFFNQDEMKAWKAELAAIERQIAGLAAGIKSTNDELEERKKAPESVFSPKGFAELEARLKAQTAAYNQGTAAVKAFEREQQISAEVARLAKGDLESERAAIRALVEANYAAADAYQLRTEKEAEAARQAQERANERLRIEQQIQAELERNVSDFTLSIGLELDEDAVKKLSKEFEALDDVKALFKGVGATAEASIEHMIDAVKSFKAASADGAKDTASAYAKGTASALLAVQQFTEQGSKEYQALSILSGTAAVAAAATAPPPLGFANGAAMAAAIAGLGIQIGQFGSGSGAGYDLAAVQAQQGTGSVLGDASAQSESIANAIEAMERNSDIEVGTSQQMLRQLQQLNQNISGLGTVLARQFGDFTLNDPDTAHLFGGNALSSFGDAYYGLMRKLPVAGKVNELLSDTLGIDVFGLANDLLGGLADGLFGKTTASVVNSGIAIQSQNIGELMADGLAGVSLDALQFATIQIKKKSWFSSSTSYRRQEQALGDDIQRQLGLVVGGLYQSVLTGAQAAFGLDVSSQLNAANLAATDISLRGLSGSERTEALQAVFGKIGDQLAGVIPRLSEFQVAGEGLFETLGRVSADVERARYQLEGFGLELGDIYAVAGEAEVGLELIRDALVANAGAAANLIENFGGSEEQLVEFGERIFDLQSSFRLLGIEAEALTEATIRGARGTEALQSGTSAYISGFLSDTEQLAIEQGKLAEELAKHGLALPGYRDGFRDLFESLDLSTDEGQRLAGVMLANADAASSFYDSLEQLSLGFGDLRQRIADLRGLINTDINGAPAFDANATRQRILAAGNISPIESALSAVVQAQQDVVSRTAFANSRVGAAQGRANDAQSFFDRVLGVNNAFDAARSGVASSRSAIQNGLTQALASITGQNRFEIENQSSNWYRRSYLGSLSGGINFDGDNASLRTNYSGANSTSRIWGTRNFDGSLEQMVDYFGRLVRSRADGGLNSGRHFDPYGTGFGDNLAAAREALTPYHDAMAQVAALQGNALIGQVGNAQMALDAANDALAQAERDRTAEIAAAEANLADVRGASIAELATFKTEMEGSVNTLSDIRSEILAQVQAQEQLAGAYANAREQVQRTLHSIRLDTLGLVDNTNLQRGTFNSVLEQARGASGDQLVQLAGQLNSLAQPFIDQLRQTSTSRVEFDREAARVMLGLSEVNALLEPPVDMQAQSVELLGLIDAQLAHIDEGLRLADELQISTGERQVELLTDIRNLIAGQDLPQFSTGGIASGSTSGYMAELHGTEAVVPLPNGKSIPVQMSGSGNADVVAAINNLANRIEQMEGEQRAALIAVAKNTRKSAQQLDSWDKNGMPPEEVAA